MLILKKSFDFFYEQLCELYIEGHIGHIVKMQ